MNVKSQQIQGRQSKQNCIDILNYRESSEGSSDLPGSELLKLKYGIEQLVVVAG